MALNIENPCALFVKSVDKIIAFLKLGYVIIAIIASPTTINTTCNIKFLTKASIANTKSPKIEANIYECLIPR